MRGRGGDGVGVGWPRGVWLKAERRQHAHDAEHLREERIASEQRYAAARRERDASEEKLQRAEAQMALLQTRSHGLLTPVCLPVTCPRCRALCAVLLLPGPSL
jgi:hypothetical protein